MSYVQWVLTLVSGLLFLWGALWVMRDVYRDWKDPPFIQGAIWIDVGLVSGLLVCSAAVLKLEG